MFLLHFACIKYSLAFIALICCNLATETHDEYSIPPHHEEKIFHCLLMQLLYIRVFSISKDQYGSTSTLAPPNSNQVQIG